MKHIFLLSGLSGAGKTTIANKIGGKYYIDVFSHDQLCGIVLQLCRSNYFPYSDISRWKALNAKADVLKIKYWLYRTIFMMSKNNIVTPGWGYLLKEEILPIKKAAMDIFGDFQIHNVLVRPTNTDLALRDKTKGLYASNINAAENILSKMDLSLINKQINNENDLIKYITDNTDLSMHDGQFAFDISIVPDDMRIE